jgi:hypothetical protein
MNSAETKDSTTLSWAGPISVNQAIELIDYGVLLKWRNMRTLKRSFNASDEEVIIRQFARRLVERASIRLQTEILVESLLVWLANATDQRNIDAFLDELLKSGGYYEACWAMVEVSLTSEIVEKRHSIKVFEMAVAVICELGKSLYQIQKVDPETSSRLQPLLDYIATFLVSVANKNSSSIRLSLLHYFGTTEHSNINRSYVNKIMMRFGHTVLDHLFGLLFKKRSESIALQYLLDNLPFVMEADNLAQKIVFETFKSNLLKRPERFCLFLNIFADHLAHLDANDWKDARIVFMKHLGALLKVASEFNPRAIGTELVITVLKLKNFQDCASEIERMEQDHDIKDMIRSGLHKGRLHTNGNLPSLGSHFRSNKRGRKPSFAKSNNESIVQQVHYLGSTDVQKAS